MGSPGLSVQVAPLKISRVSDSQAFPHHPQYSSSPLPILEFNFYVSFQPLPYSYLKPGRFLHREVSG